jgi:cellulose synthase/poly-beta-1,6-N-acetylglucosamine synthase-like glycosyltransferase
MNQLGDWAGKLLITAALLVMAGGVGGFGALLRGCFMLRMLWRRNPDESGNVLLKSPLVPAVSVLMVCRDASPESRAFVRRLLCLDFGRSETILVLDNPNDAEREAWTTELRLVPSARISGTLPSSGTRAIYQSLDPVKLVVVETTGGKPSEAWNAAANRALSPVLALFEANSEFPQDALHTLIRPMLEDPTGTMAVCGGGLGPLGASWPARFWGLEETRVWLGRAAAAAGWDRLVPVPGSVLLVRADAIAEAGGFRDGPLDTVLALRKRPKVAGKPHTVALIPDPVCYAHSPKSLQELRNMVRHDQHELAHAVFSEGLSGTGWFLPALVAWRLVLPLAETVAYLLLVLALITGQGSLWLIELTLVTTVGTGVLISLVAVVLRELAQYEPSDPGDLVNLFSAALLESLGYRQLRNLWLIAGFFGK